VLAVVVPAIGQLWHVAELGVVENFPAMHGVHDAPEPVPVRRLPTGQVHVTSLPVPVQVVNPVTVVPHVLCPVAPFVDEPVGHGEQLDAALSAAEYVLASQSTHVAVAPVPKTFLPASVHLHAKPLPLLSQVKPADAVQVVKMPPPPEEPVGHAEHDDEAQDAPLTTFVHRYPDAHVLHAD